MENSPEAGRPAEDNEESDEFLCAIAVESINDAVLLLNELRSGSSKAMPHLERALALLSNQAHIVERSRGENAEGGGNVAGGRLSLSPMAIDLIVDRRLREIEAQAQEFEKKACQLCPEERTASSGRIRQQAIMFMVQALGLLDSVHDDAATSHLQLAIDRTLNQQPGLTLDNQGEHMQPKPH